jgi:hypothetical protein
MLTKNEAMEVLHMNCNYTRDDLIRQYRLESLKHHPDKNSNTPESTARFQKINEAYHALLDSSDERAAGSVGTGGDSKDAETYGNIFLFFVRAKFGGDGSSSGSNTSSIEDALLNIVANNYTKLLVNLNKQTAIQIYEFMQEYADIFYLRPDDLERMRAIVADKMKSDNIVVLNPSLSDLLDKKIYRLEYEGQTFMVPLWHNEIYFPLDGTRGERELIVRCNICDLPYHVHVDEHNDMTISVRTSVQRAFDSGGITVSTPVAPGVSEVIIPASALTLAKTQQVSVGNGATIGIPRINTRNIYDTSAMGRVIVCVELY